MEPEKTPHSQRNVEKEKQSWRHHNSSLLPISTDAQFYDLFCILACFSKKSHFSILL